MRPLPESDAARTAELARLRALLPPPAPELPPVPWAPQAKVHGAAALRRADDRPAYVIFAQGRTGSTLLGDLLASHPEVHFGDEALRAPVRFPMHFVQGLRALERGTVYGFHVKLYHLRDFQQVADPIRWLRRLHERGWLVVHLRRENLLRHVLSNYVRTHLARPHLREDDGRERPRVRVDPDDVYRWARYRDILGQMDRVVLGDLPRVEVVYERDLLDPERWQPTADAIYARLGLDPRPVTTSLRRINVGPISDIVENYEELAARFAGTEYAHFLD